MPYILAGVFIKEFYQGNHTIYLSQPTWANHKQIFEYIGFKVASYPYWNNDTKSLDLSGVLESHFSAPDGSVFLLHACAHNPTGLDPNQSQWDEILAALEKSISSFLTLHIKVLPVEIWKKMLIN